MTPLPPADPWRRRFPAACCTLAPATLLAAFVAGPSMAFIDARATLRDVTAAPTASTIQAALLLVSSALFVPVLTAGVHLLPGRGRVVGRIGAAAFLAGICGHLMLVTARLVLVRLSVSGLDPAQQLGLTRSLLAPVFGPITVLELCFDAGLVLLFVGLWRAGAVSAPILGVIVGVAVAAGVLGTDRAAFLIAGTGGLVAGAYLSARMIRTDDGTWRAGSVAPLREPDCPDPQPKKTSTSA
jgi:hypothetical protein